MGFNDATRPFWIGKSPAGWWQGSLADVQVFDRVLVPHDFTGQLATDPLSGGFNEPGILTPILAGSWDFDDMRRCYLTNLLDTCQAPDPPSSWGRWLALTRGATNGSGHGNGGFGLWLDSEYFPNEGYTSASEEYARSAVKTGTTPPNADGNQFTIWQDTPVLRTDDSFTLSAWSMIDSLTGSRAILSQRGTHESAGWLKYTETEGKWSFVVSDEDATTTATEWVSSTSAAAEGVWTHLTGVYDASRRELRLYVNGQLQATKAMAFTPMKSSGPLLVGRTLWHDQFADQFSGGIDDVAVFQGAMTDTAVLNSYNAHMSVSPGTNTLAKGESLSAGQYLRSDTGNYQLWMQDDSNLVLTQAGFPLWDTETRGIPGAHLTLQTDGNLVVYSRDGTPVWHTNTRGSNASRLVLRDNGDLVLLDPGGTVIWHR